MSTKLVVCDLDGTTVGRGIPEEAISQEIRRLKELGIKTTIATGRFLPATLPHLDLTLYSSPLIIENGALTVALDGQILTHTPVTQNVIEAVRQMLYEHEKRIALIAFVPLEVPDTIFQFHNTHPKLIEIRGKTYKWVKGRGTRFPVEFSHWLTEFTTTKIILDMKHESLTLPLPDDITYCDSLFEGTRFYDITADNVSKGLAVRALAKQFKIDLKDVVVVGNDLNDISMFEIPGVYSAAIDNDELHPQVAASATTVIKPEALPRFLRLLA